jgi:methyl-accepting chemotaxis protein
VNTAITQMDEVTQQNAALVEEAAAAAESLQEQAQNLAQTVAVFRVASAAPMIPAQSSAQRRASNVERFPAKVAKSAESSNQAPASAGKVKPIGKTGTDDEWSEF